MIPGTIRSNPWVQLFFFLGLVGIAGWLFVQIWSIVLLFALAFFLAYILDPAVDGVEDTLGVSRLAAVAILLTIIVLIMTGLGYYLTQQAFLVAQEIGNIVQEPPDVRSWVESVLPEPFYASMESSLKQLESRELYQRAVEYARTHLSSVTDTLGQGSQFLIGFARQTLGAVGIAVNAMVFVFATIYFLRDFDTMVHNIRKLIPMRFRAPVDEIFREIDELLRAFFRGHLIVSVTIGILYGTGYLLVGLKGGFLIGFLSGLMNFIPYLGPTLGFLFAFGLGLYQFGFGGSILGILIVFVTVQSLEGNILTPNIVGGAVGLNPVTVIFALLVFGKFFGFIGLLLAIPFAGVIKVLLARLLRYYRASEFYRRPPKG